MSPITPVYIVLLSAGVGGAEKRFLALARTLYAENKSVFYVAPPALLDKLSEQPEFAGARQAPYVIRLKGRGWIAQHEELIRFAMAQPSGTIFHYPLRYLPLVHTALRQKVLVSWVDSTFVPTRKRLLSIRGLYRYWELLEACHIDVLNPFIAESICHDWPHFGRKLTVTDGGSFVDFGKCRPGSKTNLVVFSGRFIPEKNALALAQLLPRIHGTLLDRRVRDVKYVFMGDGPDGEFIRGILQAASIPFECRFEADPIRVLAHAKVFLSLQQYSNYPSRAAVEAMACGAYPIVTDVGDSRLLMSEPLATFVRLPLDADELAAAIGRILLMPDDEYQNVSTALVAETEARFDIRRQCDYFLALYQRISES